MDFDGNGTWSWEEFGSQRYAVDYDRDDNGLIEVSSLAQLNAIRWDLDGDGLLGGRDYAVAFPDAPVGLGCPSAGCTGYELTADLDFDTNGSGSADAGDDYWNDGAGWDPLGDNHLLDGTSRFRATFDGRGHTISNLYIRRPSTDDVGLVGFTDSPSAIRNVGLISVDVTGRDWVGPLAGYNASDADDSHQLRNWRSQGVTKTSEGWWVRTLAPFPRATHKPTSWRPIPPRTSAVWWDVTPATSFHPTPRATCRASTPWAGWWAETRALSRTAIPSAECPGRGRAPAVWSGSTTAQTLPTATGT